MLQTHAILKKCNYLSTSGWKGFQFAPGILIYSQVVLANNERIGFIKANIDTKRCVLFSECRLNGNNMFHSINLKRGIGQLMSFVMI